MSHNLKITLSIREAMIYISELIVKKRFNQDWFGQERVRRMKKFEHNYSYIDGVNMDFNLVFTDDSCGFEDELPPLFDYVGNENVLLIRLFREGFNFEGDSRQYVSPDVTTVDIFNNGTEEEYKEEVYNTVKRWLNE